MKTIVISFITFFIFINQVQALEFKKVFCPLENGISYTLLNENGSFTMLYHNDGEELEYTVYREVLNLMNGDIREIFLFYPGAKNYGLEFFPDSEKDYLPAVLAENPFMRTFLKESVRGESIELKCYPE